MPIPTELVGSLPRPEKLQNAYQDLDDGKIGLADLQKLQDEAAEDSIKRLEQTGETYVTDGEQRESSFATIRSPTLWRARAWPRTWPPMGSSSPSSTTATTASSRA